MRKVPEQARKRVLYRTELFIVWFADVDGGSRTLVTLNAGLFPVISTASRRESKKKRVSVLEKGSKR